MVGTHLLFAALVLAGQHQLPVERVDRSYQRPPTPIVARGAMNGTIPDMVLVKTTRSAAVAMQTSQTLAFAPKPRLVPNGVLVSRVADTGWTIWQLPKGSSVAAAVRDAKRTPGVVYAQPLNRVYALYDQPDDPDIPYIETSPELIIGLEGDDASFRRLWHLTDTNAEGAWGIFPNQWFTASTKPTNGPRIAVIDTGADMGHPDFINKFGSTTDVTGGGQLDWSLSKQFQLGQPYDLGSPNDTHGHGTHVAGLALAAGNNGGFAGNGIVGIGYNATGMILRVFDDGGVGTDADAAGAIFFAADNGADIINLSLGTENYSQLFQDAVTYAFQKGCLVIAAGNEDGAGGGDLGPIYPAACSGVLGVSANGPDLIPATSTYSGYGYYVDVAAPGGDAIIPPDLSSYKIQFVFSTAMRTPGALWEMSQTGALYPPYNFNYAYLAGTSMATPIVSGAAALYYGKFALDQLGGYANVRAYRAIEKSAIGVMGAPYGGWEQYQGYGSLDIATLLTDGETRGSQYGAAEGIVYYNATPIGLAAVKAKNDSTAQTFSTTTQQDGTYRFEALPPGVYTVTSAPFGALKNRKVVVKAGSDTPAVDMWCGTFFWDETNPTIHRFEVVGNVSQSSVLLRHWAYDTETGIDKLEVQIGTSSGASDVLAPKEIVIDGPLFGLSGFSLPSGQTCYLRATYTSGSGYTSYAEIPIVYGTAHAVSGSVALADFVGTPVGRTVSVQIRTPGSTTALETHEVVLGLAGSFTLNTNLVGTYDLAFKGSHWLRKLLPNVAITTGGASGLSVSLVNGDVNGDNTVNLSDLTAISRAWRSSPGDPLWNAEADLNGDVAINLTDRNIVSRNWRMSGAP